MDPLSLAMGFPGVAFLLWGAYVCIFSRDRRSRGERRARPRAGIAGRRRTDIRAVQAETRVEVAALRQRRAA